MPTRQNSKIDFVITWVDGSDLKWQKDFAKHQDIYGDKRIARFRDWDNLQYLFRAFEEFTPWVNKIYFVTYGHLPKWLNVHHEKLVIIRHDEFIDKEKLPLFNSCSLEINLHKIEGLSEKFVYFNDDTFILKPLKESDFFIKGLPRDVAILNVIQDDDFTQINNMRIINRHTKKRKWKIIFSNPFKWFSPLYGLKMFRTILLLSWSRFTGFRIYHHPQPFLKSTFDDLWNRERELLDRASSSKFRSCYDVNQYLFRYWQFIKGDFYPDRIRKRRYKNIKNREDAKLVSKHISSGKYEMYCPNDAIVDSNDFNFCKDTINNAFKLILPNKSSFEM